MDEAERLKLIEQIRAAIKAQNADELAKLAGRLTEIEQKMVAAGAAGPRHLAGLPNPFATENFQSRLKALAEGATSSGRINLGLSARSLKTLVSGPADDNSPATFPSMPTRGPVTGPAYRRLGLVDLLPSIAVTTSSYDHVRLTRTAAAAVQAREGDQKAELNVESELVNVPIATIAHWIIASKQVISDNSGLQDLLRTLMSYDVVAKFEDLLVNGDATNTGEFDGLIELATTLTTDATPPADRIAQGIAAMTSGGFTPAACVLNPDDWATLRTERSDGGSGPYLNLGGWANPAPPVVWGLPIVSTPSIAAGTALLLDPSRLRILDREAPSVMVSTEDRDNFVKNLLTILGEMRGALACYDTGAIGAVDIGST